MKDKDFIEFLENHDYLINRLDFEGYQIRNQNKKLKEHKFNYENAVFEAETEKYKAIVESAISHYRNALRREFQDKNKTKSLENDNLFIGDLYFFKEYNKILENSKESLSNKFNNSLQWYGAKSELIELTKALIENGNLKGNQEDIFKTVQEVFNIELKNIDQAITKFNTRKQENETKFLDRLKTSLSKYIKSKLEKNR